jgi:hypothetical protein
MTRDEILNMPAGQEMNVLIAPLAGFSVFKSARARREWISQNWNHGFCVYDDELPDFSDDISAAWMVVERMTDGETPNDCELHTTVRGWRCDLYRGSANAETAPLAICRAALLAILEKE